MIRILASNVLIHASGAIAPAVALSILLRRVGFAEFGQVLACQTLVALFVGVSDLGCSILGLQRVAERHHARGAASTRHAVRLFLAFRSSSALAGGAALLAYLVAFRRDSPALLVPTLALFACQALTPTWALLALEATGRMAGRVVVARAAWLAATLALARGGVGYLWLVLALNAALLVVTTRALEGALDGRVAFARPMSPRRFGRAVRATVSFSLSRVSVNVYQAAPLLLLSHLGSSVATGVYATIETIHKVFATASHPVTEALFGRTARTRSAATFVRYGVPLLLALYAAMAAVAVGAGPILSVLGGGRAAGAAPQLRLILVATALSVTSLFVGYPLAGGLGRIEAVNRTTFVSPFVLLGAAAATYAVTGDALYSAIVSLICAEGAVLALRVGIVRSAFRAPRLGALQGELT